MATYSAPSASNVEHATRMLDAKHTPQHDGDLLELGTLAGFFPAARRNHARHAYARMAGVHEPGELLDEFGFGASRPHDSWLGDQARH
jgi:hypothetical protein